MDKNEKEWIVEICSQCNGSGNAGEVYANDKPIGFCTFCGGAGKVSFNKKTGRMMYGIIEGGLDV